MRLWENAHLTLNKSYEGLTVLSKVDPSTSLRVDAEQDRSIEGLGTLLSSPTGLPLRETVMRI